MADLSDVETALVNLIGAILYPNGFSQPSILGLPAKIYGGWPVPGCLDGDLAASTSVTNISVYPAPTNRNTTRYLSDEEEVSVQTPTLGLVVSNQTVTVTGSAPGAGNPHNLCVFVNSVPYVVQATSADTPVGTATKLATAIATDFPGTSASGAVVTVASSGRIGQVRVGITGTIASSLRNQEQVFQIGIWASAPDIRDQFAKAIDTALARILRFVLPDSSICKLTWKSSLQSDKWQKQNQYRRDLFYTCEYATVDVQTATQITQIQENNSAAVAGQNPVTNLGTIYE